MVDLYEKLRALTIEAEAVLREPDISDSNRRYFAGQVDAYSRALVELENLLVANKYETDE